MDIPVIFEDDFLVVINKPAGVVCNRAESVKEETLQDWMEYKFKTQNSKVKSDLGKEFVARSGLVHRLDKETSGVMVLAKNPFVFDYLKNQFKQRKTRKMYVAMVHGNVVPSQGTVNLPLRRNILNRRKFCVNVDGKLSKTCYEVLDKLKTQNAKLKRVESYSFMRLWPKTGRTHQLRVHMSHLGYPIVSDPLYLGKRLASDLEWCPRLFLHAKQLSFVHPDTEELVTYVSDLHEDLERALKVLESSTL